ncbi:MAG TPA: hypothetical protein VI365_21215 [Trebonia sp.]
MMIPRVAVVEPEESGPAAEAARSNAAHLEEIVQALLTLPGVVRTKTEISLNQRVATRVQPLIQQLRQRFGDAR